MQLRLALSVPKFTGAGFNQTTSAILTGVTIAGAFSTVIFNSTTARTRVTEAFQTFAKLLSDTPIYSGVEKIAGTFKQWGTTIVAKKDEFKQWVENYLNASGLKSGAAALYEKLYDWAKIVYEWFRDKFLVFLSHIPDMVQNWKKLRLSLFKWGTFLGGGGAGALWSMFGSFDDIGKLADLMGNEDFMAAAEKFAELVGDNPDAFKDMGEENMKEILERIAEEPKDALEIIKELQEQQEAMAKEEKEKAQKNQENQEEMVQKEEEKKPQLNKEQVMEAFKQAKGSPQNKEQVFGQLAGNLLQELSTLKPTYFSDVDPTAKAKSAITKYMEKVNEESKKDTKSGKANKAFLDALGEEKNRTLLIDELTKLASKAFRESEKNDFESLKKKFEDLMESNYTEPIKEGQNEGNSVEIRGIIQEPATRASR